MSYITIENIKYQPADLPNVIAHNERKNPKYGDSDINLVKSYLNYHLIKPKLKNYEKEFERIRQKLDLKGYVRLSGRYPSYFICEFVITSDDAFFKTLGIDRTKQFFADCHDYISKKCGVEHIISSVVHLDESTPHLHMVYIPVIKDGEDVRINYRQFWKGFNGYGQFENDFYKFCKEHGYEFEREWDYGDVDALNAAKLKVQELTKQIESLTKEIQPLKNEKNALQAALKAQYGTLKHIRNIEAIPIKKSIIGNKVTLSAEDFYKIKELAKQTNRLIEDNKRLRERIQSHEQKKNIVKQT